MNHRDLDLIIGALVAITIATMLLVVFPYAQLADIAPPKGLKPYTADTSRGWGRVSVPADYVHDRPPLMGTMRTGPDLFNIGARQPSSDWHLAHLYQPRAVSPGSIMPGYPYLFRVGEPGKDDVVVNLPEAFRPAGKVIASQDALDLVEYMKGLDHTYPISDEELAATGDLK